MSRSGLHRSSLAAAEGMHVDRERLDRDVVEPAAPRRASRRRDRSRCLRRSIGLSGAVEPDGIAQVRRAELALALAVSPWQTAQLSAKTFLPAARSAFGSAGKTGERAHVVGDVVDRARLSMPSRPKAGMRARPCVLHPRRADAVADGLRDLVEIAAPDPFVIVEVRIALARRRRPHRGKARNSRAKAGRPCARAKSSSVGSARDLLRAMPPRACRPSGRAAP